jgi:hypothetical protein
MTGLRLLGQRKRVQAGRGALGGPLVEQVRNRVRESRARLGRGAVGGGRGDVSQGELMHDDQGDGFVPGQQAPQRARVTLQRVR